MCFQNIVRPVISQAYLGYLGTVPKLDLSLSECDLSCALVGFRGSSEGDHVLYGLPHASDCLIRHKNVTSDFSGKTGNCVFLPARDLQKNPLDPTRAQNSSGWV